MKNPKRKFSDFTDYDIAEIEQKIAEARENYEYWQARFDYSVRQGHEGYAKRNHLPSLNQAKDYLETLQKQQAAMLASMEQEDSLRLTQVAIDATNNSEPEPLPWGTIGLAIGAIVLIVIVYKVI